MGGELYPLRPDPIPQPYEIFPAPTGLRSDTIDAATCRVPKSINNACRTLKTAGERLNLNLSLQPLSTPNCPIPVSQERAELLARKLTVCFLWARENP